MNKEVSDKKEASVARNVIIYGIGGVLSQAAGLITLPLMTRFLSSWEYGSIEVITSLTGYFNLLIGLFLGLSVGSSVTIAISLGARDEKESGLRYKKLCQIESSRCQQESHQFWKYLHPKESQAEPVLHWLLNLVPPATT